MTLIDFIEQHPGWTLVYLIVVCGCIAETARAIGRRRKP